MSFGNRGQTGGLPKVHTAWPESVRWWPVAPQDAEEVTLKAFYGDFGAFNQTINLDAVYAGEPLFTSKWREVMSLVYRNGNLLPQPRAPSLVLYPTSLRRLLGSSTYDRRRQADSSGRKTFFTWSAVKSKIET